VRALLLRVSSDPLSLIEEPSVVAVGAFVRGCAVVDPRVAAAVRVAAAGIPGPSAADVFTRAYLRFEPAEGIRVACDLVRLALDTAADASSDGTSGDADFPAVLVDCISENRMGLVLGAPTVAWLANYCSGFLSGLAVVDPAAALEKGRDFAEFSAYVGAKYGATGPWHRIVSIFESPSERGVRAFASLWRAYRAGDR